MTTVRVIVNGQSYSGYDERPLMDIVDAVKEVYDDARNRTWPDNLPHPHDPEAPIGWVWIANAWFRADRIDGIAFASTGQAFKRPLTEEEG